MCSQGAGQYTEELDVLGTYVTLNGDMNKETTHRINKGFALFYKFHKELTNQGARISHRIRLLNATAMKAMIWGMEAGGFLASDIKRINFAYTTMISKMIRIKKREGQKELEYHIERMRAAKKTIQKAGYGTMADHIFKAEWNFAKVIAKRAHQYNQRKPMTAAKLVGKIATIASMKQLRQKRIQSDRNKFYALPGRKRRMEEALQNFVDVESYGEFWIDKASDYDYWNKNCDSYIAYRTQQTKINQIQAGDDPEHRVQLSADYKEIGYEAKKKRKTAIMDN